MAKVIKIAGLVVGAAVLAVATAGAGLAIAAGTSLGTALSVGGALVGATFGVSAGTLLLGAAALSTIGSALSSPHVASSQTERLTASIDPRAFRKTVLGQTAMATDIRYEEWSGKDQEYCDWIVALASHAADGVEEIWLEQEMAWSATTGVVAKYAGYFSVPNIVLEGSPANAITFASGKWNQAARLTGCAYLRIQFKVTGNGKKAESPFASSIPSRVTIIGRGAKLYDPRRDSTVPGGSGPMRWDDQSTWRYTADDGAVIGENLALQILRVVLGWRIRNPVTGEMRLATGSGVPGRRLDMVAFQVAANLCDELVNRSAGGTEPRYHGAGVISEGDDPKQILDMLCAACSGRFRDTAGKLSLVISHNDLAAAAADDGLSDDDVVGAFTWDPDPALEATPNVARGRYVDATSASLYQLIDYPEVRIASLDGQDRIMTLDLGVVESPSQAQRVVKQALERRQYQRSFSSTFDIRAWKYTVGDVVPFTFAPLSFTRVLFRVASQELGQGGTCDMTLSIEHQQIYAWDASDAPAVLAADPIVYDKGNNPLILGINEAATMATAVVLPGAAIGGTIAPDGTIIGGAPASTIIDALAELASTGDQTQFIAGVKALVDRGRLAQQTLLAVQLLGEERKELTDALTHLNGVPMGSQVTRVERQQIDGDRVLAESIEVVSAGVQTLDGTVTAQVARLDQAIVDGDHAQAMHLETVQAQLESTIGGVDSRVSSEVTRLDTAIASGDEAQASALQSTKAELQGGIAGVDGRVTSEIARVDKAIADGDGAQASALQSTKAELQGGIAGVDGRVTSEVTRLDNSVAAGDKASADALASTKAELQGGIAGVDGRVTSEVSRLDSAISTGDQAQASALQSTKAELQGGIAGVDGRVTAEVTRLDSSIAAVDHAQSTALQSVEAGLNGRVTSEVTRIDQAIADQESSTATSLAQVQSTVDGQTATVEFLMQSVNGEQALAQLSVTIRDNGVAQVTGMKINGQQRSIVFGADLLVVGNSSIFQVDTTTGVVSMNDVVVGRLRANSVDTDALVDHAVTGFVSIDGISGEIGSDDTTSYSDALTITTHGGVVRIDVNFDVSILSGKGPQFSVQLLRNGGGISREFLLNYSSATGIGLPNFFTLVDTPPAGTHAYGLVFGRMTPTSGTGTSAGLNYANGAIYAQEFKK